MGLDYHRSISVVSFRRGVTEPPSDVSHLIHEKVKTASLSSNCQTREGSVYVCTKMGLEYDRKLVLWLQQG